MENVLKSLREKLASTAGNAKSDIAKIMGAIAIFTAFQAMPKEADAQTIVNKKQYEAVVKTAETAQESIGESMAELIYGGKLERRLQIEIGKQNSKNDTAKSNKQEFSLFKDKDVKSLDEKGPILSKEDMEKKIKHRIDSIATKDFATFYKAFQEFQASGVNLVGNKMGKGESGRNLAPFTPTINIDYLEKNKDLPYNKKELEAVQKALKTMYEKYLSARQKLALENRKNESEEKYGSAILLSMQVQKEKFVDEVYKLSKELIVAKIFNQNFSTKKKD